MSYSRVNDSLAQDIEQDVIFFGIASILIGVGCYLIYQKITSEGAVVLANAQEGLNNVMGGEAPIGSDVAPGSTLEPENEVGYE
jgi:hypothetical protein